MKKLLFTILFLVIFFSCSQESPSDIEEERGGETVDDGLKWYDVVEPATLLSDGITVFMKNTVVKINPDPNNITAGTGGIALIERNDTRNFVGSAEGVIKNNYQQYVNTFEIQLKAGYAIKMTKGKDLNADQWVQFQDDILGDTLNDITTIYKFRFYNIADRSKIAIGSELAVLRVYDNPACSGDPMELFTLVL